MLFYICLFNQYTWILLDLPEKYKALLIYFYIVVLLYLSMFVICLFFYADLLTYKITPITDKKKSQIELFKSSVFFFHIAITQKYIFFSNIVQPYLLQRYLQGLKWFFLHYHSVCGQEEGWSLSSPLSDAFKQLSFNLSLCSLFWIYSTVQ